MLSRWEQTITDEFGNRIDQPTVRVQYEITGAPNAVLKADKDGVTPLSNSFTPASGVDPFFYVAGGFFKITITKGAYTKVLRDVALGTAAGSDSPPFIPAGDWDSVTEYVANNLVQHDGRSFFALQPSTDVEPGVDAGWADYWWALSGALVDEPDPTLGADLDLNGHDITGTGDVNITGGVTVTGAVAAGNGAAATPSLRVASEATGWFLAAAGNLGAAIAGVAKLILNATALRPATDDSIALGASGFAYSDAFFGSGAVVNFGNGNATLTHSSGQLTSSVDIVVPSHTYGSDWNASNEVPTKNDVYDKLVRLPVNILDYGAIGDGDIANASTNATALTNALATGRPVLIPYTSSGYHFGTNTITIGTGQYIIGERRVTLKSTAAGSDCFLRLTGFQVNSGVENVTIDMTGSGSTSTAIRYGLSSGVVYRTYLKNIRFINCVEAVGDETPGSNYIVEAWWENLTCELTRGRQFYSRKSRGFFYVNGCVVDRTLDTSTTTWEGARFEDAVGIEFNRFDVVGQVGTTAQAAAIGLVVSGCTSVWMDRCLFDNSTGPGVQILTVNNFVAKNLEVYQNLTSAIYMASVTNGQIVNLFVEGNVGLTGAAAGAHGVYMDTCSNVQVSNLRTNKNTGSGLALNNCSYIQVTNCIARDNTAYGIVESGTSDNNHVTETFFSGNGSGTVSVLGANSRIAVPVREVLSAARTYYVRTDGSNSNTGRANTSGGAFLTLAKAMEVVATLDFNGYTVTVQVGDGTYTAGCTIPACVGQANVSNLIIQGNSGTPGNVIISTTSASCIQTAAFGKARIKDMELRTTTSGYCLSAVNQGVLEWTNLQFGACAQSHVIANAGGQAFSVGNYAIVGAASAHIQADGAGSQAEVGSKTVTITGTPAFGTAFAISGSNGVLRLFLNTYSGSATGARYLATNGGGIATFGAGATALPGNSAGTATSPGWYA